MSSRATKRAGTYQSNMTEKQRAARQAVSIGTVTASRSDCNESQDMRGTEIRDITQDGRQRTQSYEFPIPGCTARPDRDTLPSARLRPTPSTAGHPHLCRGSGATQRSTASPACRHSQNYNTRPPAHEQLCALRGAIPAQQDRKRQRRSVVRGCARWHQKMPRTPDRRWRPSTRSRGACRGRPVERPARRPTHPTLRPPRKNGAYRRDREPARHLHHWHAVGAHRHAHHL